MKKIFWFKMDRNDMLMSSYFVCKHIFDVIFSNLLSEFNENSITYIYIYIRTFTFFHFFD